MNELYKCPAAIRLILHIHAIAEPIDNITAPVSRELIESFLRDDLIRPSTFGCEYETTTKGRKWVDMIVNTPIPTFMWIDPREIR